jgi:hypothetical protein
MVPGKSVFAFRVSVISRYGCFLLSTVFILWSNSALRINLYVDALQPRRLQSVKGGKENREQDSS